MTANWRDDPLENTPIVRGYQPAPMTRSFLNTQLHLVNRTLRQAGQCEARPTEEQTICTMAALGHDIRWIGTQVLEQRTIAYHGDIILGA